jgi:hypothetical protein
VTNATSWTAPVGEMVPFVTGGAPNLKGEGRSRAFKVSSHWNRRG